MPDSADVVPEILNDIRSYTRIAAASASRKSASIAFDSFERAIVYGKMDGKTSTYKISEATGIPQRTVASWADDFVGFNLAAPPDNFHSSHRALFTISELGIDMSTLKRRKKQELNAQEQASTSSLDSTIQNPTSVANSNG